MNVQHVPLVIDGKDLIADLVIQQNGAMIAIHSICDVIGIDRKSQQEKIKKDTRFTWGDITLRDSLGRNQAMFCLPVEQVVPWLFTVNSNKVKKSEVKETLLKFQIHLGKELNAVATGLISSKETAELKETVQRLEKQNEQLTAQYNQVNSQLAVLTGQISHLIADNAELRKTNEALWRSRNFESSSASYSLHAAKARRRALKK